MTPMYQNWANSYDQCVRAISILFWQKGILKELKSNPVLTKVLDLGAGTGVGASLLKQQGQYEVYSLDQSAEMLKHATDSDHLLHLDIAQIDQLQEHFDYMLAGFNAMNYLSYEHLSQLFKWASLHLSSEGLVVFDYSSPYLIRWNHRVIYDFTTFRLLNEDGHVLDDFSEKFSHLKVNPHLNRQLVWHHEFEVEAERCKTRIQYVDTASQKVLWEEVHYQYAFNCYEMEHLIFQAGLKIEKIRDLHGSFFTPSTYTHIYVLRHQ